MVRKGYKQTDAGAIPEEWGVSLVRDLVRHGPQNGYSGPIGESTAGTPTLSLAATSRARLVLNDMTVKYLKHRVAPGSPLFLEDGDVLVQRSNTAELVGTTAIFNGPPDTFVYPDLMMRLRFARPQTASWFWRYANSATGRVYFRSVAAGSTGTMPKISGEALRKMPVSVPPDSEQKAVAEALSDADTLIDSLEQLLAKKRNIKQGAMQELLTGKRRLPGFESCPGYKQTDVGVMPVDWDPRPLGEMARAIFRGASPRPIDSAQWFDDRSTIGWVRISDLTKAKRYLFETTQRLSEAGVRNSRFVPSGSLIMSICATVGRPIETRIDVCIHDGFVIFDRPSVSQEFLYHALKDLEPRWSSRGQTGSQMNLNTKLIKSTRIPLPPSLAEQIAIAEVLSAMDEELGALEIKLTKAQQIKQGMMQELLTGRTRLV